MTELTGQLRFLFCHSVALKDSLTEELLPDCFSDYRPFAAKRFWLVRAPNAWNLLSHRVRGGWGVGFTVSFHFFWESAWLTNVGAERKRLGHEVSQLTVARQESVRTREPVRINSRDGLIWLMNKVWYKNCLNVSTTINFQNNQSVGHQLVFSCS